MSTPVLQAKKPKVCDLCEIPLPSKPVVGRNGKLYCCHGCAHVDEIISTVGSESPQARKAFNAAKTKGLISGEQQTNKADDLPDEIREEKRLRIDQLACPSCAWLVESVIESQAGVAHAEVDYFTDTARVVFDLSKTSIEDITSAVDDSGYGAHVLEEGRSNVDKTNVFRLAVAFFIALNQMMLAWVGYDLIYPGSGENWVDIVAWMKLITAIPVVTWCAMPLYQRAIAAIKQGRVVMETLLSLGIISASTISVVAFLSSHKELYLESATMLVTISLAGRWLESWIKHRTAKSLTDLLNFSPNKARDEQTKRFRPITEIIKDDVIEVQEGETVPLDIISFNSIIVREGLLTGESHPVSRASGSVILAGSVVEKGALKGRVVRISDKSVASSMQDKVFSALRNADSGSRFADRLAQGFVPLVIMVAIGAFAWHAINSNDLQFSALTAISVLVVSCPCAFGMASSSALSLAILGLAKKGLLVKDPGIMENTHHIDTVVFDKTGTLTKGELSVETIGWVRAPLLDVLDVIRNMEATSAHPIGVALHRLLPARNDIPVEAVVELPGLGITATANGQRYAAGKIDLFSTVTCPVPGQNPATSRVWFGLAGEEPIGFVDISDKLRNEAQGTIEYLQANGIETILLSGDDFQVTQSVAKSLNIDVAEGDLKPDEKAKRVKSYINSGKKTAFVGDGLNDAEAIAESDLGFAMAAGVDLAMVSAPVVLTNNNLNSIAVFFRASKKVRSVLKGNFTWAFLYNVAMIPIAATGLLLPVFAASLMALSSVSVGLNSLRLRKDLPIEKSELSNI